MLCSSARCAIAKDFNHYSALSLIANAMSFNTFPTNIVDVVQPIGTFVIWDIIISIRTVSIPLEGCFTLNECPLHPPQSSLLKEALREDAN